MLPRLGCGLSNGHEAVLDGAPVGPAEHGLAPGWVNYTSFLLNGPGSVPEVLDPLLLHHMSTPLGFL